MLLMEFTLPFLVAGGITSGEDGPGCSGGGWLVSAESSSATSSIMDGIFSARAFRIFLDPSSVKESIMSCNK